MNNESDSADPPQQVATAVCPACGGHLQLSGADRLFVVCGYCQSTLARHSTVWNAVGRSGDDFLGLSALSLHLAGVRRGVEFLLVGREQYFDELTWHTDWHVTMADNSFAQLSESDGGYVWYTRASTRASLPEFEAWKSEATVRWNGQSYRVTAVRRCQQGAAEGEVGRALVPGSEFGLVEFRSHDGGVLRIDYASLPAQVWVGERVEFPDLKISIEKSALRSVEELLHVACPACGGQVRVKAAGVMTVCCSACGSLADLSEVIPKAGLASLDGRSFEPLLPLGTTGHLEGVEWQVIGFEWREGKNASKTFSWSEYQLYNPELGFAFVVVDRSVWRFLRQLVGAPKMRTDGQVAHFQSKSYSIAKRFETVSIFVSGEFSRRVEAGRRTVHSEYRYFSADQADLLCVEFYDDEEVWLAGETLAFEALIQAFPVFRDKSVDVFVTECPACGRMLKLVSPNSRTLGCGNCRAMLRLRKDTGESELLSLQTGSYAGTPALRSWIQVHGQEWQVLAGAVMRDHEKNISYRFNLFARRGTRALLRKIGEDWHLLVPLKDAVVKVDLLGATVTTDDGRTSHYRRKLDHPWSLSYFEGESPDEIVPGETFDAERFVSPNGDSLWRETVLTTKHIAWWTGKQLTPEEREAISPQIGLVYQVAYSVGKWLS